MKRLKTGPAAISATRVIAPVVILLFMLIAPGVTANGTLEVVELVSIAPVSIPVDAAGNAPGKVGMVRMGLNVDPAFFGAILDVTSFDLTLTGTIDPNDVSAVYVYFETQNEGNPNDGVFAQEPANLVKTTSFGGSSTITVNDWNDVPGSTLAIEEFNNPDGNGFAYFYVAFDFVSSPATDVTVGCTISNIVNDGQVDPVEPTANATVVNVDDYEVTVTGDTSGLSFGSPGPGDTVTALELTFDVADTSLFSAPPAGGYAKVDAITFQKIGTATDGDFDPTNAVRVFRDNDSSGTYNTGDTLYGSGSMSGGYATVPMSTPIPIYTDAGNEHYTYYAAVLLNTDPTHGNTVGLRVENPSTDITFADGIDDAASGDLGGDYYNQEGYITSSTPTPASPDTFTIITDPDPPQVSDTTPLNGAPGVSRYLSEVRVVFNEDMDAATIVDANFVLEETLTSTPVSGTVSISGDNILVFSFSITPDLSYDTNYTATVTGPGGVADLVGNEMAADYSWSFQTELPVYPNVTSTFPEEDTVDVAVDIASVRAVFSERMEPATIIPANFSLVGPSGSVDGTLSYEENPGPVYRLVFVPDSELEYNSTYTVTVTTGVQDLDGLNMLKDKVWQFTTIRLYPEFDEPIAIKNRIGTGANDQTLIFVPQPPGGAGTRMSVQVFTTTGKLVRTFYRNVPWSTIGADPIAWDGTNDRGQNLGPGLYFVQIKAADYKRVLKVMIVR